MLLIVKGIFTRVIELLLLSPFKKTNLLAHHHQLELESHGQVNVSTGIIYFFFTPAELQSDMHLCRRRPQQ